MRALFAIGLTLAAGAAAAQSLPPWLQASGLDQPSYLTPAPLSGRNPLTDRSRDYSGVAVSDWLFYPQALVGAVYNDNLTQTQTRRTAAAGTKLQASVAGLRDSGVSRTLVYGEGDATLYPAHAVANTYNGRVGVNQTWNVTHDFTLKAQAEVAQQSYLTFGGLVETPGGVASLVAPQTYKQATALVAAQKSFGRYFLGVSLGETATMYDALATSVGSLSQSYRNSAVATFTQRGGYWVSPLVYAYAETAENWRRYADAPFGSQGYRAVAGLGSDRIGLFRGEVYGGYQGQSYQAAQLGQARSPVFGGKLYWYVTRAWTLTGLVNETFSDANNPTPSNPQGDPARVATAQIAAQYQLGRRWSAQALAEFDASRYLGVSRADDTYIAGAEVNGEVMRNIGVSVDYKYLVNRSSAAGASFINNILGASATYKF